MTDGSGGCRKVLRAVAWAGGVVLAVLLLGSPVRAERPVALSLAQAQSVAVEGNQMLRAARKGVERAQAMKLQTLAGHLPTVRLSEGVMRSNDAVNAFGFRLRQERFTQADFDVNALNGPQAITNFQTKLEILQPVFNGGETIYRRRQASLGVTAAERDLARGEDEVRFHTAEAYWGMVLARASLEAVQQALETARAHAAAAEARHRQETAPLSDVLAARVRVAELREQEIVSANRVRDAADGLSLIMGLEAGADATPADALALRPVNVALDALVARALMARPDLMASRSRAEAAEKGIGAARAAYIPHLNAFVELELDSDNLLKRRGESWMAGAMVTWNVFSGFRSVGAVRAARAEAAAADAQADFRKAEAVREVRKAYREVTAASARVGVADEALRQADERLRMTGLQYQEGLVTAADLLDAETAQTHTRLRKLAALHDLNVGLARLSFVVGEPVE